MGRSPATFAKRQRELAKKEKKQLKLEKRAQRKHENPSDESDILDTVIMESSS
jgi:hypothetical protein